MFNPHTQTKTSVSISILIQTYNIDFDLINKGFKSYFNLNNQNDKINIDSSFNDCKLIDLLFKNINYLNMVTNFTFECIENYKSMDPNTLKNYKAKEVEYGSTYLDLLSLKLGNIYDLASKVESKTKRIIDHFNSIIIEHEKNNNNDHNTISTTNTNSDVFKQFKLFFHSYKLLLKLISYLTYDIKRKCRNKFQTYNEIICSILKSIKEKSELVIYLIKKLDIYNQVSIGIE